MVKRHESHSSLVFIFVFFFSAEEFHELTKALEVLTDAAARVGFFQQTLVFRAFYYFHLSTAYLYMYN